MFKVNNKDTRTTLLTSYCCLCSYIWIYFRPFSSVSIVTLEEVLACREHRCILEISRKQGFKDAWKRSCSDCFSDFSGNSESQEAIVSTTSKFNENLLCLFKTFICRITCLVLKLLLLSDSTSKLKRNICKILLRCYRLEL